MSIKDKYNEEAIEKIKDLAEAIDFTMFITNLENAPLHSVPMSTKKVDNQGNIWFLTSIEHDTAKHIAQNEKVQLIYSKPGNMEFLNLYGEAHLVADRVIIKDLYQSADDSWFDGDGDPKIRAIVVNPKEAQYWEPKSNKAVTLFKMAYGAITGNKVDISQEGELRP
ncbi:pyridoxamine 5'-phosphate oxidase family protein [Cryomorpha ignava]|uniref:Pyridoxamine 5'-phosphate oxidase family protein n=1 Tax=Cryomorpha ignava TaxID=101383 RepID=A0A7K3WNB9_9FLAO|nr:pyridoxamine 5'-phosphate oxidase family protein [Cryomorpha ignava]NEN23147.1 pyridoxamine 5'-phosphate oxidase family protein [Cryomorpha ignava]